MLIEFLVIDWIEEENDAVSNTALFIIACQSNNTKQDLLQSFILGYACFLFSCSALIFCVFIFLP